MISKTIGYNGVHNIFRQTHLEQAPGQGLRRRVAPSDQEVENQIR